MPRMEAMLVAMRGQQARIERILLNMQRDLRASAGPAREEARRWRASVAASMQHPSNPRFSRAVRCSSSARSELEDQPKDVKHARPTSTPRETSLSTYAGGVRSVTPRWPYDNWHAKNNSFGLMAAAKSSTAVSIPGRLTVRRDAPLSNVPMWSQSLGLEEKDARQCILHPNGQVRVFFDCISLVVILYDLTVIPLVLAWDLGLGGFVRLSWLVTSVFWLLDLLLGFVTGYSTEGGVELRPRRAAANYLRTAFGMDLLILLCDVVGLVLHELDNKGREAHQLRLLRFIRMSRLLRFFGLLRILRQRMGRIMDDLIRMVFSESLRIALRTVALFALVVWVCHLVCCLWFFLGSLSPSDTSRRWTDTRMTTFLYQYSTSLHWSMAQLTLGNVEIEATNTSERFFSIGMLLVGLLFSSVLAAIMSSWFIELKMSMMNQHKEMQTLRDYLEQHSVDRSLGARVLQMAENGSCRREWLNDRDVAALGYLPSSLHAELRTAIYGSIIKQHPLFNVWHFLGPVAVKQMCCDASPGDDGEGFVNFEFLAPGDELFVKGQDADRAFYIVSGTLHYDMEPAMVDRDTGSSEGLEVAAGTWLAEAALWSHWRHVGTAFAKSDCQVLSIRAAGVVSAMRCHEAVYDLTWEYGAKFCAVLALAVPPERDWPTDLEVPMADWGSLVQELSSEARTVARGRVSRVRRSRGVS